MAIMKYRFRGQELITVPVIFVSMVLDTGATYTMIPWKIAQSLGFEPERVPRRVFITTASSTEEAPLITLNRIFVLGKKLENIQVVVHDLPPTSRIDGLLGLNVLRSIKAKIDFQEEVIEIP